jgi:hypothetical protein
VQEFYPGAEIFYSPLASSRSVSKRKGLERYTFLRG